MKKALIITAYSGALLSVGVIVLGALILKSTTVEVWGIAGFILFPFLKGLRD